MSFATASPFADLLRQLGEECLDMLRDLAAQGDKEAAELLELIEAEGLGEAA